MIMGIDTFLDMGRIAANMIGNTLAASVVDKWENKLATEGAGDTVPPDSVPGDPVRA
jgi:Na+/H+-dicarboxylate symporter